VLSTAGFAAADDWQVQVSQPLGKLSTTLPGGIYRVALPRTDLTVTLDGVELKAGFALGSWLAFGDPVKMAAVFHDMLAENRMPYAALTIGTPPAPPPLDIDTAAIDAALGAKGRNNGGVYSFGIPRAESVKAGGMSLPPAMGTATAINFQPTGGGKAAITGDFVLTAKEVQPVGAR
jgi:hypothetical protein